MRFAIALVILIATFLALVAALWSVWWLAASLIVFAATLLAGRRRIVTIAIVSALVTAPLTFNQISNEMDRLGTTIRRDGAEALTTTDRVAIFTGNIAMAIGGLAIWAPEVALETLFLMYPHEKQAYRVEHDFAMGSRLVRELIEGHVAEVAAGRAPMKSERIPVNWLQKTGRAYGVTDYRVALAVAGGGMWLDVLKTERGYAVGCRLTIDVAYSENYRLDIFNVNGVRLYIDEAIFSALQDLGWFHTYLVHFEWSVEADEYGRLLI